MLTIITVTFNNIDGLRKTSKSISDQCTEAVEWIIVDGGSTDNSLSFIQNCKGVSQYISEKDRGIYDAMHKGLHLASGDWVLFLNAGDTFADLDVINYINAHLGSLDVYFYACRMSGLGVEYLRRPRPLSSASYSVPAIQQATVYKRDVLLRLDWPTCYRVCGDFAIAAQLLKMGATSMCDDRVVAKFELGGVSTIRPVALAIEAYQIQSQILKLPVLVKVFHFTRRLLTGYFILISYRMRSLINRFRVISNA
jgi:putative colanic acid biosynthesis glycosyltransferase